MSIEDVSRQVSELTSKVDGLHKKIDGLDSKVAGHDARFDGADAKFKTLEQKIDEGFTASKVRDEELLRLTRFGLEADEVLRESLQRSFAESNRKQDEQISLLTDVLRNHAPKK